jgi:hypothetical protein
MIGRIVSVVLVLVLAGSLGGCVPAGDTRPAENPGSIPATSGPPSDGAAGTRLAPGLYELADGSAQALGTLDYRDLEGGIWVIVGGTEATGDAGKTVAVIANAGELAAQLEGLRGATVIATGKKLEGVSVRMAGPEIAVTSIEKVEDTVDPAQ